MKISQKMMAGFGVVVVLLVVVGLFGLHAGNSIINSLQVGDRHMRSIVGMANNLSISAKNAENHLFHYLISHEKHNKENFFHDSLLVAKQLVALETIVEHPKSRELFADIRTAINLMQEEGEKLITKHEQILKAREDFPLLELKDSLRAFYSSTSSLRKYGIQLAGYATDFLNRQEAITAATDICSYAKRAEGHLLLYLTLHAEQDKQKFFSRIDSLQSKIETLERRVKAPEAQSMLAAIKAHTSLVFPVGNALLTAYNKEKKRTGSFNPGNHLALFEQLRVMVDQIVMNGNALAGFNTELEIKTKQNAVAKAMKIKGTIITVILFTVFLATLLGYFLSRSIVKPVQQLQSAMVEVGNGNFAVDVDLSRTGEIGDLAATFKSMATNLNSTTISRDYVDNIINSMAEALLVISQENIIKRVNDSFCILFGYRNEEVLGESFNLLLTPQPAFGEDTIASYLAGHGIIKQEVELVSKNGDLIPVLFSASRIQTSVEDGTDLICVIQDMSSHKAAEEARRNYEVEKAMAKMASLIAIGELSSRIVHEMRNPLASIQMNLEALSVKVEDEPFYSEMANISLQQVVRLETMLTDLLNYGKPLGLNREKTTFAEINSEILQLLGNRAKGKSIEILVEDRLGEEPLFVDKELIIRALVNLVDNSIYWTPKGGSLRISAEKVGADVRISVNDSGPGISKEVSKKIFQPFITGREDGTGLGLANVKKIIEYHGGTVLAATREDKGAVFTLQLPTGR